MTSPGRIIPALAGNTRVLVWTPFLHGDHPRSRGEYPVLATSRPVPAGSSPLSRGIRDTAGSWAGNHGIIPALAGNTARTLSTLPCSPDHPRSRGEYVLASAGVLYGHGSSPLSRGILSRQFARLNERRIIPALAGNTPNPRSPRKSRSDHPRSRGEYHPHRLHHQRPAGSSPLSRGIPCIWLVEALGWRIIPALAGNTARRLFSHRETRIIPALAGNTPHSPC